MKVVLRKNRMGLRIRSNIQLFAKSKSHFYTISLASHKKIGKHTFLQIQHPYRAIWPSITLPILINLISVSFLLYFYHILLCLSHSLYSHVTNVFRSAGIHLISLVSPHAHTVQGMRLYTTRFHTCLSAIHTTLTLTRYMADVNTKRREMLL